MWGQSPLSQELMLGPIRSSDVFHTEGTLIRYELPVVIFSHVLDWEQERQQVKAVMHRYGECRQFLKPVEPDDLLRGIADILNPTHKTQP